MTNRRPRQKPRPKPTKKQLATALIMAVLTTVALVLILSLVNKGRAQDAIKLDYFEYHEASPEGNFDISVKRENDKVKVDRKTPAETESFDTDDKIMEDLRKRIKVGDMKNWGEYLFTDQLEDTTITVSFGFENGEKYDLDTKTHPKAGFETLAECKKLLLELKKR